MEAVDLHAEAWEGIRKGCESGRLAHAYVISGSPRGQGLQFAESFLKLLFCQAAEKPCGECISCRQVENHKHVDTLWIEPQSKSRQIVTDDIALLIRRISQTSFEGGWKAGVILSAECMNTKSSNQLLKTLEEPPPKSILLLVTDSPQSLLPTILSRCQKIVLASGKAGAMDAEWQVPLLDILHDLPPSRGLDAARLASQLKSLFDTVRAGIADAVETDLGMGGESIDEAKLKDILAARINARLKEVQADVFRVMLDWHRDVLMLVSSIDAKHLAFPDDRDILLEQATYHTPGSALQAVQVVEGMAGRVERNIPDLQIFDEAFRKLVRSNV
jgi:DNA polymerase-3 subunit delta'